MRRHGKCGSDFLLCLFVFLLGVGPSVLNNLDVLGRSSGGFNTFSVSATWLCIGLVFPVLHSQESALCLGGVGRFPSLR